MTVEQAEALFAEPKRRRGQNKSQIAELGPHPETGARVRVLDGRFGPYVTDGTINATVPRGVQPEEIDLEQGIELLREREARGPVEKRPRKAQAQEVDQQVQQADREADASEADDDPRRQEGHVQEGQGSRPKRADPPAPVPTPAEPTPVDS